MPFIAPVPLIRKRLIIKKMDQCGATSASAAKTFAEAGIINPNGFSMVTKKLIRDGVLGKTADGKYYLI